LPLIYADDNATIVLAYSAISLMFEGAAKGTLTKGGRFWSLWKCLLWIYDDHDDAATIFLLTLQYILLVRGEVI